MDALFLIGRFLFGLLFVVSGLAGHLAGYKQLTGYAAAKKVPLPGPAVLVSASRSPGRHRDHRRVWPDLSALVIAVFLF